MSALLRAPKVRPPRQNLRYAPVLEDSSKLKKTLMKLDNAEDFPQCLKALLYAEFISA